MKKQAAAAKFTLSSRPSLVENTIDVGPGSYNPKKDPKRRSFVATIGNSPKSVDQKNTNPGPTHYNLVPVAVVKKKEPCVM